MRKKYSLMICCMLALCCGCGAEHNIGVQDDIPVAEMPDNTATDFASDPEADSSGGKEEPFLAISELVNKQSAGSTGGEKNSIATLPKRDYEAPENIVMVPSESDLTGAYGDYVFVPIDGEVYRYEFADDSTCTYQTGALLYEFSEETVTGESQCCKIFELEAYPNHEKVECVKEKYGSTILQYAPALKTDKEIYEEAQIQGFVILNNGSAQINKDNWLTFISMVEAGEPATVCIGYLYTNERINMSEELAEATKEDVPSFFMQELTYDGDTFTLAPVNWMDGEFVQCEIPGYNSATVTFPYLMHYKNKARLEFESYTSYDKYVLTDRADVSWEDLEMDSITGTYSMCYEEVYCEYAWKN